MLHSHSESSGGESSPLLVAPNARNEHAKTTDSEDLTDEHSQGGNTTGTDNQEADHEGSGSEGEEALR